MVMAWGKNCEKYLWTTAACVSIKPASKWHLNMARTRLTSGFGGVPAKTAGREFESRALLRVRTDERTKSLRFMFFRGMSGYILALLRCGQNLLPQRAQRWQRNWQWCKPHFKNLSFRGRRAQSRFLADKAGSE